MTVPVTLTVASAGTPFFDNMPGQLSFTLQPGGAPSPYTGQITVIQYPSNMPAMTVPVYLTVGSLSAPASVPDTAEGQPLPVN